MINCLNVILLQSIVPWLTKNVMWHLSYYVDVDVLRHLHDREQESISITFLTRIRLWKFTTEVCGSQSLYFIMFYISSRCLEVIYIPQISRFNIFDSLKAAVDGATFNSAMWNCIFIIQNLKYYNFSLFMSVRTWQVKDG